jgi:Ser/Thr protein kinase RdoA (MazF antagonist)
MIDSTPAFTTPEALRIAHDSFGITASVRSLPSERDQNFALETSSGTKYVLKIANCDEEYSVLAAQNAALRHVRLRRESLAVPEVVSATNGADIITVTDKIRRRFHVRLLTWISGDMLVTASPHSSSILVSLGIALAELDLALTDFQHPAVHRKLRWDVRHADLAREHLHLLSPPQVGIVRQFMPLWEAIDWQQLRHGTIHGDANDYNVLVRSDRVAGFLDFGDIVHSALPCDLAIALAYVMLEKAQPLEAALATIQAYNTVFPLTPAEIDALYPLAAARLCMSVCYAAYNATAKSTDAYQQVTSGPAWKLLTHLAGTPADRIMTAIRTSCGR